MELGSATKLLSYAIFTAVFAREVIVSFIKWSDSKVAISVEEMKSKYVKFPSISVCLDVDTDGKGEKGFRKMRPLNETFSFLHFVRHFDNG